MSEVNVEILPQVSAPVRLPPLELMAAEQPSRAEVKASDAGDLILKQKLDCALQLARTVSLDFNNALTSILGHVSFLLSKAEAGHPWRHALMEVEKSAARAAEVAHELQTFSRQEKETRRAPPGNLNLMVNRCVEFFRNAHGGATAWKPQLEKGLFAARFDEAKVQQALTKILENAFDAVAGGASGQVIVQTRNVELSEPSQDRNVRLMPGVYVCMEVSDNGSGIAPDVLPRVFEPFFTTKKSPHRGLGLVLAYGIVTNHGGGVAISSEPGKGTSVRIYLPAEKEIVQEPGGAGENFQGTETILVVDDEDMLLSMTETILSDYGYTILTANNGTKALAVLSRDDVKVNLVVTDLVMPGMGGRELVERIRQLAPEMKILCTSGYVVPADKKNGLAYLQKPFTSDDLLAKVKRVLSIAPSVD
jgi:two-component system cell cycle sensor histidine kinase/response regulator CckA